VSVVVGSWYTVMSLSRGFGSLVPLPRCEISTPRLSDCCLHIRCRGNVFTERLPSNGSTCHNIAVDRYMM
jgi:hypothetical protein